MTTLAHVHRCFFGGYEYPREPGMLPNAGAQEQMYLWAAVMIVLVGVMYVRVRPRVMGVLGRFWTRPVVR